MHVDLMRRRCRGAAALAYAIGLVACTGRDLARAHDTPLAGPDPIVAVPADEQLAGFAKIPLVPSYPPAAASGTGVNAPTGTLWYRLTSSAPERQGPAFEWYVHATKLQPTRAYRFDLTVDGNSYYSVGAARTDSTGTLVSHGTATRFADEYCVSTVTGPQPIAGQHRIGLVLKNDGSGSGPASAPAGPFTDPGRSFPCHGNGDGLFDAWLQTRSSIIVEASDPAR